MVGANGRVDWIFGTGPVALRRDQAEQWATVLNDAQRAVVAVAAGVGVSEAAREALASCVTALRAVVPTLEFLEGTGPLPAVPAGSGTLISGRLRQAGLSPELRDGLAAVRLAARLEMVAEGDVSVARELAVALQQMATGVVEAAAGLRLEVARAVGRAA
jgi:hypothetical protein